MTVASEHLLARDLDEVFERGGALWEELRGARVFITGGTGFFGCWLLETFCRVNDRLQLGATATVLTRSPEVFAAKAAHLAAHRSITLVRGDVRSIPLQPQSFSHVVHAATDARPPRSDEERLTAFETIVSGTRETLEFARRAGASRFLLTSSGAVYGRQPAELTHIPEDYCGAPDATDQNSFYGEGKRAAETLCALYAREGFAPMIARCFAFVGPYLPLDLHFAIGNFVRDALAGGPIRVNGDGTPYRSYLYASDLALWLWTILLRGQPLRPYNVGSEEAVRIADLARVVGQQVCPSAVVAIASTANSDQPAERYVPRTVRIRAELGVRSFVGLEDAVCRTAAWHSSRAAARLEVRS